MITTNVPRTALTDVYLVPFQGETIECERGLDAVAVKFADSVLAGCNDGPVSPNELQRLAIVLERYGRIEEAQRLRIKASRSLLPKPIAG